MASVRVRGCVDRLAIRRGPHRQADASRRRNGPRKAGSVAHGRARLITERLSGKPCPAIRPMPDDLGRRPLVAEAAKVSAGECGDEDQVGRTGAAKMSSY